MRRTPLRLLAFVVSLLLAASVSVAVSPVALAAGPLAATFSATGSTGQYQVTNSSSAAVSNWVITFRLPAGVTASTGEHATISQVGTEVTLTPAYYIATLQPGRSTYPYNPTFRLSTSATPTACRIAGANCDGSADTAPAAPTNLRATVVTTRTVSLAWNASAPGSLPVAGYDVLRNATVVASVTRTEAAIAGLTPNTAYTFAVVAKDANGLASSATQIAVRTNNPADDAQPPSAPSSLRSTGTTDSSVSLAWNAATDNTGVVAYDVYRGTQVATTVTGTTQGSTGFHRPHSTVSRSEPATATTTPQAPATP